MPQLKAFLDQFDDPECLPAVRRELAALIRRELDARRESLCNWEKVHFSNAIGSLALNVHSIHQPTTAWLRLCIADLERAVMPASERLDQAMMPKSDADELDYNRLASALEAVAQKIDASLQATPSYQKQYATEVSAGIGAAH